MPSKAKSDSKAKAEPIEVFLAEPGEGRPPFSFEGALEYLPADGPAPLVGDIILLPRGVTGDTRAQAFAWGGTLSPFRVVEREHVYFRDKREKFNPTDPRPARFVRTMICVHRLGEEEFYADPGTWIRETP